MALYRNYMCQRIERVKNLGNREVMLFREIRKGLLNFKCYCYLYCSEELSSLVHITPVVNLCNIKADWHDWRSCAVLEFG